MVATLEVKQLAVPAPLTVYWPEMGPDCSNATQDESWPVAVRVMS
ncbi:hypothetical protein STIAU_3746 [Stigmatella aurantiaca DW4/3-1]|uniref:Uncharacterized protein n=1 Tax=Stigmatella aurantiaca (strain DW4/3-1) TaxID=378806 RepID=Q09C91_STIAD|nr:hypothetical protein STIAU_3746 [Stigmatella aurantiaca DW4/3-1]